MRPGQHHSFRSFSSFLWDVGISSVKDFNEKGMVIWSGYFLAAQIGDFNSAAIGDFRPAYIGDFRPTLTFVTDICYTIYNRRQNGREHFDIYCLSRKFYLYPCVIKLLYAMPHTTT